MTRECGLKSGQSFNGLTNDNLLPIPLNRKIIKYRQVINFGIFHDDNR